MIDLKIYFQIPFQPFKINYQVHKNIIMKLYFSNFEFKTGGFDYADNYAAEKN